MASSFDVSHQPSTQFERNLRYFLDFCTELVKELDNKLTETKEIKAGLHYYNTAFKSTMTKAAMTHEMHLPTFTKFVADIPSGYDDLMSREWFHPERGALYLKFVKQEGNYADKVMLNLTGIYNACQDEADQYQFTGLLLRCCELAVTDATRQAIYGRAACECELTCDSLAPPEEEQTEGGFREGLEQFKKAVFNKGMWKTVVTEGVSALDEARKNPAAVATLELLGSENNSLDDKVNAIKNLVDDVSPQQNLEQKKI